MQIEQPACQNSDEASCLSCAGGKPLAQVRRLDDRVTAANWEHFDEYTPVDDNDLCQA